MKKHLKLSSSYPFPACYQTYRDGWVPKTFGHLEFCALDDAQKCKRCQKIARDRERRHDI